MTFRLAAVSFLLALAPPARAADVVSATGGGTNAILSTTHNGVQFTLISTEATNETYQVGLIATYRVYRMERRPVIKTITRLNGILSTNTTSQGYSEYYYRTQLVGSPLMPPQLPQ